VARETRLEGSPVNRPERLIAALWIAALLFALLPVSGVGLAAQGDPPVWQAAEAIRDELFDAQLALFSAEGADAPEAHREQAVSHVEAAEAAYVKTLAASLSADAPAAHEAIRAALADAAAAAQIGDGPALADARGRAWTGLLWGAYDVTLAATAAGDAATADAWSRLREFRVATRVSTVDNAAAAAISTMEEGQLAPETAAVIVGEDLRDTYFFRLREALNQLESAAESDYPSRAAEWAAQAGGYFRILRADYAEKQGESAAADFEALLVRLSAAAPVGDWAEVADTLAALEPALAAYQPVELSAEDIAQKSQLLYIFTDLIYVEYRDGVRNGRISIETEYREAVTFHEQAELVYAELRPIVEASDPARAERLADLYVEMDEVMSNYGDSARVEAQVDEALEIVVAALGEGAASAGGEGAFTAVDALLDDLLAQVAAGDYAGAERVRVQAYALYDFGPELHLLGLSPRLVAEADGQFWHGYRGREGLAPAIARQAPEDEVAAIVASLRETLAESEDVLNRGTTSPTAIAFNAAAIVFREGLEAVIILAALLASMAKAEYRAYRRPLVGGSILALIATTVTWVAAQRVLQSFSAWGERLEAVVSLVAIGVLLLITNWFFHKVYWKDWIARFHRMKGRLMKAEVGQMLGLVLLGFSSMYREGFETVLFLQALVLDAGSAVVFQGIAVGLVAVAVVGFLAFSLQRRLPYMHMLIATGVLIGLVLVTMVGGTVRTMQAVGWLPISPLYGFQPPYWLGLWFGVHPTWQGIAAQVGAGAFVIGSYTLAEYQKKRRREHQHKEAARKAPEARLARAQVKAKETK
jgi:high-affinity iron transporter